MYSLVGLWRERGRKEGRKGRREGEGSVDVCVHAWVYIPNNQSMRILSLNCWVDRRICKHTRARFPCVLLDVYIPFSFIITREEYNTSTVQQGAISSRKLLFVSTL